MPGIAAAPGAAPAAFAAGDSSRSAEHPATSTAEAERRPANRLRGGQKLVVRCIGPSVVGATKLSIRPLFGDRFLDEPDEVMGLGRRNQFARLLVGRLPVGILEHRDPFHPLGEHAPVGLVSRLLGHLAASRLLGSRLLGGRLLDGGLLGRLLDGLLGRLLGLRRLAEGLCSLGLGPQFPDASCLSCHLAVVVFRGAWKWCWTAEGTLRSLAV